MPVQRLSQRLQPHNERGSRGAFAHTETVPGTTSPRVPPRKERERVSSPHPLPGSPRDLPAGASQPVSYAHSRSLRLLPFRFFGSPFSPLSLSTTSSRHSRFHFSSSLATAFLSARPSLPGSLTLPPPSTLPRPADDSGGLSPGLGFRPVLVLGPLPALAVRDPLPDPLGRPRLLPASDISRLSMLGVGTSTPAVADATSDLVQGDVPLAWYPPFPRFGGSLWHPELRVLAKPVPSKPGIFPVPALFLSAKPSPPQEIKAALYLPLAHFEPRGSIVLNVVPTRRRGPPDIPGLAAQCRTFGLLSRRKVSHARIPNAANSTR